MKFPCLDRTIIPNREILMTPHRPATQTRLRPPIRMTLHNPAIPTTHRSPATRTMRQPQIPMTRRSRCNLEMSDFHVG